MGAVHVRAALVVAVLGATLQGGGASAHPATGVFTGVADLPHFGLGIPGTGTFEGVLMLDSNHPGPVTAVFTYFEPAELCPVLGTATGTISSSTGFTANFTWNRVGAVAVVNLSGAHSGSAIATFRVTRPVGNPCGATGVRAQITGVFNTDGGGSAGASVTARADVDGDGDGETFVIDPTLRAGQTREVVPEQPPCDHLPEPARTECEDRFTTRTVGFDDVVPWLQVVPWGDGDPVDDELVVIGGRFAPALDLDFDGDPDVLWR